MKKSAAQLRTELAALRARYDGGANMNAVDLTDLLDHLADHLIESHGDPDVDIKLLRQAAEHCDAYADALDAYLNGDRAAPPPFRKQ